MTTQEEMFCCFDFGSTCTHRVNCITKIMPRFMFVNVTKVSLRVDSKH